MLNAFKEYIRSRVTITDQEWDRIAAICTIKKLRKKQYLLQEGEVWKHYAFIIQGCLRTYTVDEKGDEHIISFAAENWWAGDRESLLTGNNSIFNIDAIEDSIILLIKKADFEAVCKEIPAIAEMVKDIAEKNSIAAQKRIHAVISYTAQEQYLNFITQYPGFASRVPQHMIAAYLGISAETLSRVRKQTANTQPPTH
ncbi:Crp/Fnr family transcriptional regulator [Chitinophaga agrisoli]|uniref:Crp/Fnr family transcriptional regulator n=1 Tax=Chitinophaga agrisoli TaxID=2607653 RepID=A0A5B2VQD3_9BACT|nr:Crp/Fnr family transcriptional regulator [Chitinophaga agrisoli]